ncbi:MAG: nucleotidyltransferase domain-containing protein [Bacteroidia bacterium]|nr:nucleotidyltransferase domain-containing protein [Bacteroidia bacterium]
MAVADIPVELILAHPLFDDVRQGLAEIFEEDLDELVLFGSMAIGRAHADSDIDLLIVLDREHVKPILELSNIGPLIAKMNLMYDELLAPVIVSKRNWVAPPTNPLLIEIKKHGKSIWKK